MELIPTHLPHPSFREIFERLRDNNPELSKCGEMMVALIEYLEDKVDAPAQWAGTRGPGELIIFPEKKYVVVVSVNAHPRAMSQIPTYEIKYAVERPWHYAVGYTSSLEEAAQMVLHGCRNASLHGLPSLKTSTKIRRSAASPDNTTDT